MSTDHRYHVPTSLSQSGYDKIILCWLRYIINALFVVPDMKMSTRNQVLGEELVSDVYVICQLGKVNSDTYLLLNH